MSISTRRSSEEFEGKRTKKKLKTTKKSRNSRQSPSVAAKTQERLVKDLDNLKPFDEDASGSDAFDDLVDPIVESFIRIRDGQLLREAQLDDLKRPVRNVTRTESAAFAATYEQTIQKSQALYSENWWAPGPIQKITLRRLKQDIKAKPIDIDMPGPLSVESPMKSASTLEPPDADVVASLYNIRTTPFEHSFLSRLSAIRHETDTFAVDWESTTPWMELMADIHEHYSLRHPERPVPSFETSPIRYSTMQQGHLLQVHDLLERTFWAGIDVSDSLDPEYYPEKCTVIASYKSLVVGVALISSPRETYLTFLSVRAGWEGAGIATSLLHAITQLNPHMDLTLHVSANNPAMVLYNRFGFKIEEFIVGFYDEYLDSSSKASKNALRLRLRRR